MGLIRDAVISQFRRPRGVLGRVAGTIMAKRISNRQRNIWTVSLLDVEPHHRVLEVGFGPGVNIAFLAEKARQGLVIGIDHSPVMLEQASQRNAAAIEAGPAAGVAR